MFVTRNFTGRIKVEESEGKEVRFFHIDNIPENISPPVKPAVDELIKKYVDGSLDKLFD